MIPAQKPSYKPSVAMLEMLEDSSVSKNIATIKPTLDKIFLQIALDITTEENRDSIGPTILALKHTQDVLILFAAKGEALLSQEKQTN